MMKHYNRRCNLLAPVFLCLMTALGTTRAQGEDLTQAPVIESVGGVLDTTLTIEYTDYEGPFYTFKNARWFNGMMPGPTLKLSAGDKLRILYQNQLTQQTDTDFELNLFTKPDHSNLHFHGAHVTGELPSDDIRVAIPPGTSFQYETDFPTNHMPGTHWIHPHVHGSSSLQVGGGAALALIVQDPPGTLPPQVEESTEVLLFVQHIHMPNMDTVRRALNDQLYNYTTTDLDNFRTVNGQYQPTISMRPGEWQRWRVVFAGWLENTLNFAVENDACEMQLLAKDGIYIRDFPRNVTGLPLPPGGRADVMVRCPEAGTFYVIDAVNFRMATISVSGTPVSSTDLAEWTPTYPDYLTDLRNTNPGLGCSCGVDFSDCDEVDGGGGDSEDEDESEDEDDEDEDDEDEDDEDDEDEDDEDDEDEDGDGESEDESEDSEDEPFGDGGDFGAGEDRTCINGHLFDPTVYLHTVAFGSVVERMIDDMDNHPYHQHVYPFQIIDRGEPDEEIDIPYYQVGDWHDVIQIDVEVIIVRYKADVHTGVVMLHCHILPHEDEGTMTQELIVDGGECSCDSMMTQPLAPNSIPLPIAPAPSPAASGAAAAFFGLSTMVFAVILTIFGLP